MKNNSILPTNEGNFQKKTNERSKYKGQVPIMDKFVKFWPGIRENETTNQNARKKLIMKDKIRQAEELQIKNWERTFRREKTGQHREQTEHQISGKKH